MSISKEAMTGIYFNLLTPGVTCLKSKIGLNVLICADTVNAAWDVGVKDCLIPNLEGPPITPDLS